MTDEELAEYAGLTLSEAVKFRTMFPGKVVAFDRMREVEREAALWIAGVGPKPKGVLLDTDRSVARRRLWR